MAEVVIVPDAAAAGELVAAEIAGRIRRKPTTVLGLATGSTPLPVYQALVRHLDGAAVDQVQGFALDEYVGLDPAHPQSYRSVITREVVEPLGLDPRRVHVPNGSHDGLPTAGDDYDRAIVAAGGVDLQILGIGGNGHLAFNEPGSSFGSTTRVKMLTAQTRLDNARFFDGLDQVPTHCITQGLSTILRADHLVLLAFGAHKAEIVATAVEGPLTAQVPASVVQLHKHATVVVDEAAAERLQHAAYYRSAFEDRLEWETL